MNTKERTKDQERKSEMKRHKVAHHEQNPQGLDENQDQEEDMKVQDKGNYGHKSQDQLHQEIEAGNSDTTNRGPATADKEQQRSVEGRQEGIGQPFQNQRNPGQRKPLESDIDPTD